MIFSFYYTKQYITSHTCARERTRMHAHTHTHAHTHIPSLLVSHEHCLTVLAHSSLFFPFPLDYEVLKEKDL